MKRILAVKLSPLDDAILAGNCFGALREAFPHARITALVEPPAYDLYRKTGWADEVLAYSPDRAGRKSFWARAWTDGRLAGALQKRRFDLALDFSGSLRSARLVAAGGAVLKAGLGLPTLKPFYDLNAPADDASSASLSDLNRRVLNLLGIEPKSPEGKGGFWPVPPEAAQFADTFWKAHRFGEGEPVVAVHPLSGLATHRWYPRQWAAVLGELLSNGVKVFFACTPWGRQGLAEIEAGLGRVLPVYAGSEWPALAGLYRKSTAALGVDSAARHLAAAVGTPTLTLWGPAAAGRRHPYSAQWHPVALREVPCRPCGLSVCVEKKHECLAALGPEEVLKALKQLLKRALAGPSAP